MLYMKSYNIQKLILTLICYRYGVYRIFSRNHYNKDQFFERLRCYARTKRASVYVQYLIRSVLRLFLVRENKSRLSIIFWKLSPNAEYPIDCHLKNKYFYQKQIHDSMFFRKAQKVIIETHWRILERDSFERMAQYSYIYIKYMYIVWTINQSIDRAI